MCCHSFSSLLLQHYLGDKVQAGSSFHGIARSSVPLRVLPRAILIQVTYFGCVSVPE